MVSVGQTKFKDLQDKTCTSYLSQVQGDVHLVVLGAAGQRGALPPPLRAVNGVGDGVGTVALALATDVTVLALRKKKNRVKVRQNTLASWS